MSKAVFTSFAVVVGICATLAGCGEQPAPAPPQIPQPPVITPPQPNLPNPSKPEKTRPPELVYIDASDKNNPAVLGTWVEIQRPTPSSGATFSVDAFKLYINDPDSAIDAQAVITATLSRQEFRHQKPAGPTGPEQETELKVVPIFRSVSSTPLSFTGYTDRYYKGLPDFTHEVYFQLDATKAVNFGVEAEVVGNCQNGTGKSNPKAQPFKISFKPQPGGPCSLKLRLCAMPGPLQTKENACK